MRYISTRNGGGGSESDLDFAEATLAGLAPDGGLYVPREWPHFTADEIAAMAGLPYPELAQKIMQPFVGDTIAPDRLLELTRTAYRRFAHAAVTPLRQLNAQHWLLDLFHGPTLAFKDIALQLLGLLFEDLLAPGGQGAGDPLTIVGATSGDTGSAAIDAVAGREHIDIFMLHPKGRVSDVQRRQMTTVLAPNVHNIAIEGTFDDAQALVKRMFNDTAMTARYRLSAVNSINWARLMAQVVYYFAAALQLGAPRRPVAFSVPTGNFGDVFAGYVAARMGLPIARLIVATNVNDILYRALSSGDYSAGQVTPTHAPSMDIQVSSNFERLLFDLADRDGAAIAAQMAGFERNRTMRLTNAQREGASALFSSVRADNEDLLQAIRWAWESCGELIDPHTAIALHAARQTTAAGLPRDVPVVTLATAHPAKFRDAVERATGHRPLLPARIGDLYERAERFVEISGGYDDVAAYVAGHATPRG